MLARHRTEEAQFFLQKLRGCDTRREFRYYLSAFLSSARSVTWVLQAELRARYGQEFDEWYRPRKESLEADRMAGWVKNARNVYQKQGSRLPPISYMWPDPVSGGSITVRIDNPFHLNEFVICVDRSERLALALAVTIDSDRPVEDQLKQVDAQVAEHIMARLPDLLDQRRRLLQEVEPEIRYLLVDEDAVSQSELIRRLDDYMQLLVRLVDEAERRFPVYAR